MDYDTYAEGEAVLGWLNAETRLTATSGKVEWRTFCSDLLETLHGTFRNKRARIGHVKLLLAAGDGYCIGNLIRRDDEPFLQGEIDGYPTQAGLTLNARVEMPPEDLERIARDALSKTAGDRIRVEILALHSLRPGRPQPTHRYKSVVS